MREANVQERAASHYRGKAKPISAQILAMKRATFGILVYGQVDMESVSQL